MLYHVGYTATQRNGRTIGGGMRHVEAASATEAETVTVAEVRASFGSPRLTVTATAKLPAPRCPACTYWHEPGEGGPVGCSR